MPLRGRGQGPAEPEGALRGLRAQLATGPRLPLSQGSPNTFSCQKIAFVSVGLTLNKEITSGMGAGAG